MIKDGSTDLEIPVWAASDAEEATDEAEAANDSEADEALALYRDEIEKRARNQSASST